jgi:hypothetical protein
MRPGNPNFRWAAKARAATALFLAGAVAGAALYLSDATVIQPRAVAVFPAAVTASHSDPSHPVSLLDDSYNNTWWGTGLAGNGAGVRIDARFDLPIDLRYVIITPGAGVQSDAFASDSRPQRIQVTVFSSSDRSVMITLADTPGAQTFAIPALNVTRVQLTLESAYQSSSPDAEVAIAEIEFFQA